MSSWTSATVWAPDDIASMTPDQWAERWPDVVRRLLGTDHVTIYPQQPKLTLEDAREIRELYAAGDIKQRTLALHYGVSETTIHNVVCEAIHRERYGRSD